MERESEVMNAVASCGLQLYRFGETVSIPYWLDDWRPDSWYDSWPKWQRLGRYVVVCRSCMSVLFLLVTGVVVELLGPRTKSWRTRKQDFIHCVCLTSKSRSRQFLGSVESCSSFAAQIAAFGQFHIQFPILPQPHVFFWPSPHDSPGHWFSIPFRRQVENLMRGRKIYEPPRFMTVTRCEPSRRNDGPSTWKGLDASDLFGQVTRASISRRADVLKRQLSKFWPR